MIGLFRVPGHSRVYVLGSFARRVTFYAQQVRALNLVDVLCKSGEVHESSTIGVVGAGVAGATAAVAAARRGLKVVLFEKHRDRDGRTTVLPRQRLSDERAIHPFIYDWPSASVPSGQQQAGLPLMNWAEGTAAQVVKTLAGLYDEAAAASGITLVQATVSEDMVRAEDDAVVVAVPGLPEQRVDALILALGFGDEAEGSYWDNDGLQSKKGEWLVSGMGDGGLTDLMRLCIDKFRHAEVVETFERHARDAALPLLEADKLDAPARKAHYEQIATIILDRLEAEQSALRLREGVSVWLAGAEEQLYSSGASVLNRLIAAYLLKRDAFRLIPHSTAETRLLPTGRFAVVFTDDRTTRQPVHDARFPMEFDGVVLRHGTRSELAARFPGLLKRCRPLKRKWDDTPASEDATRQPHWNEHDFDEGSTPALDVAGKGHVVVICSTKADRVGLPTLVESALMRARDKGQDVPRVVHVDPALDLASVRGYRRVLRALCRSEIAIVDITGMPPATMFLLGVRSVVRRGITLCTLEVKRTLDRKPEPFDIPELAFNIREASVVARRDDDNAFTEALKDSIVAGRNQMLRLVGQYQDMPAYDAVRKLGSRPEDHRPVPPSKGVLVLSSYDRTYLMPPGPGQIVATALGTALPSDKYQWLRIVQSPSPQLASQKLYAAIRQYQMCAFDWTGWRPNLFYEFGVRLAVNPTMPVTIAHRGSLAEPGPERQAMLALFAPFAYDEKNQNTGLVQLLERHLEAIEARRVPGIPSMLSPGFTFRELQRWIDVQAEAPMPVDLALGHDASALVGPDTRAYTDGPLLYDGNDGLRLAAQVAAVDRWIAAWYFLDKRHGIRERIQVSETLAQGGDDHVQRWIELATQIQNKLEALPQAGYERIKQDVDKAVRMCMQKAR